MVDLPPPVCRDGIGTHTGLQGNSRGGGGGGGARRTVWVNIRPSTDNIIDKIQDHIGGCRLRQGCPPPSTSMYYQTHRSIRASSQAPGMLVSQSGAVRKSLAGSHSSKKQSVRQPLKVHCR